MKINKLISWVGLVVCVACVPGCKTPAEVKQALVSLDQGYADNAKLMQQYQQLAQGFNQRHRTWTLYVKNRAQMDLALLWATTDPQGPAGYVDLSSNQLGPDIMKLVNQSRLNGLPGRKEAGAADDVFKPGTNTMNALIQILPALANAITKHTTAEYDAIVQPDPSSFDDYNAKVAALRRMNDAVKRYLDIDVTVKPADVKDIADSVRTLADK